MTLRIFGEELEEEVRIGQIRKTNKICGKEDSGDVTREIREGDTNTERAEGLNKESRNCMDGVRTETDSGRKRVSENKRRI